MKKFVTVIFLVSIIGSLVFYNVQKIKALTTSPCETPITYKIDTVDSRFNLSKREFENDVEKAANLWNNASQKQIFRYDPSQGKLSVNMIYDERQKLNSSINNLTNQVNKNEQNLKPEIAAYEKQLADFKAKSANLNSQISYWNQRGGAPPDEYAKLTKARDDLLAEADQLNATAKKLNQSTADISNQIDQLNENVQNFNEELKVKPEEGIYMSRDNRIEIYFNVSQIELLHTLAHELGHARGLEHIQNQTAIMFPNTTNTFKLSNDDIAALEDICKKPTFQEVLNERFQNLFQR